jgi:hypothetical protein
MKSVFVYVMKAGYRKFVYTDTVKAALRAQFQYCTASFGLGLLFPEFYFSLSVGLPPAIPWRIIF